MNARELVTAGLLLVCSCPLASAADTRDGRPEQAGQLDKIVIEGVPRMEVKGDKPAYTPDLNPTLPIQEFLSKEFSRPATNTKLLVTLPNFLPAHLSSDLALSPWHALIELPPVLDILVKHPKIKIASWRLVITDDNGKIFKTIRGKGRFPDRLTWDGTGTSGEMLRVGHPYAYSYFVLDRAQVPTYLPGKTVLVRGMLDERRGSEKVTLDPKSVFDFGVKISEMGYAILRETQDMVRQWAEDSVRIDVFGEDADLAKKQAEAVRKHLCAALHLEEDEITARGYPLDLTRYARIEIGVK